MKYKTVLLMPAYNSGKYLRPAVQSLLNQTIRIDKIVIIDDASTDGSIESISDLLHHENLVLHRNQHNLGRALSVNSAIDKYDAEFFILQDSDDISYPYRVEQQLEFMTKHPDVDCSSSCIDYIDAAGKIIGRGRLDLLSDERLNEYFENVEPFALYCPAVIIRSRVLDDKSLRFRQQFWPADDVDLWNRIAEAGFKVRVQDERLVQYRIHGGSIVTSNFYRTRLQYEWLRDCLRARRRREAEPSRQEFLSKWQQASTLHKCNRWRKFTSKGMYRSAGFDFAQKKLISAFIKWVISALLQPSYAMCRALYQTGLKSK